MASEFSKFKHLPSIEQAQALADLLKQNGIDSLITDITPPVDLTFTGNELANLFELGVKMVDFEKAKEIVTLDNESLLDTIDPDHYLFNFTDDELYDILLRPDEWSDLDYSLAHKILIKRGKPIDYELLASLQKRRIEDLSKPEENQSVWIVLGYISALLGGFLGLVIGYSIMSAKKTLPDGSKVYSYNANNRKHGKTVFILGLIMFVIWIGFRIYFFAG
jgi:hypothetical protein